MNHSAEPSPGQGRVGSVGCAHCQSLSKVFLETSPSGVCVLQKDRCQSQAGLQGHRATKRDYATQNGQVGLTAAKLLPWEAAQGPILGKSCHQENALSKVGRRPSPSCSLPLFFLSPPLVSLNMEMQVPFPLATVSWFCPGDLDHR